MRRSRMMAMVTGFRMIASGRGQVELQLRERLETWAASVPPVVRSSAGEPLLELRGVSFAYEPGTNAVEDVSLDRPRW